ncbi:MAG: hypothetical protein ACI835_002418, partial [Planctomycetota bacterium]
MIRQVGSSPSIPSCKTRHAFRAAMKLHLELPGYSLARIIHEA